MHWRLVSLFAIIVFAFVLRFACAYGISAGDDYALSGGSSASSHLRIITEILAGSYDPSNQLAINYPYGSASTYSPLFDYVMAFFAFIVSACGVSDATAASGVLAWSAPILGALTIIPVFLIGKTIFKDERIAIISALFYAMFAVLIMTTAFSNGTEYPFVCFLVAWAIYFVASAFKAADETAAVGIKSVFSIKSVRTYTLISAVFMAFIVLSWNEFWAIMMAAAIMLFVALLFERIAGRDLGVLVGISSTILLFSAVVGAIYYIPMDQWDSIFSGGCLVAVLASVYSFIFLALEKKPWVLSIPLMVVIIIAVAAVFAVALPDLSSAMLHGNSYYDGALMVELTDQMSRTSISAMASYYGWLTVWFPFILAVWMLYKYRSNARSKLFTFTMLMLFAGFFIGWFNSSYAVIAGPIFAIGTAAVLVKVIKAVDLKSYFMSFRGMRGSGFKAGAKKVLNFFPFVTVIVAVCLVAVPTAVYAADAATPTNDEHADYFGGLGYTINTSDSSLVTSTWDSFKDISKSGALLSWYGYSDTASSVGGFNTVTSTTGGGTSAMSSAYLSDGSAGAIATMAIRLIEENPEKYSSAISVLGFSGFDVDKFVKIIGNTGYARTYMAENASEFTTYKSTPAGQSLPYIAGVQYLTSHLNEAQIVDLYNTLRAATGHSINYIEVDSSMVPIYYGDGNYANTIGYFGDYALDEYGAPSEFYTVSSTNYYYYTYGYADQLYYSYNDAFYNTFLWNALLGVTPENYSDITSSLALLSALANSDGTVKAVPATGLDHFTVAYWHVNYKAEGSSEWKDMDAYEAIALQNENGGVINYLASVVVLEYVDSTTTVTGTVTNATAGSVKVAVFEKTGYDASGATSYVQRSTAYTDANGKFTVSVPSGDYMVRYYIGSTNLRDGTVVATEVNTVTGTALAVFSQPGTLVASGNDALENSGCYITFQGSDKVIRTFDVDPTGAFAATGLIPDLYTITVYSADGNSLSTAKVTLTEAIPNLTVSAKACDVKVTLTDMHGAALTGTATATLVGSNGAQVSVTVTDGTGTAKVIAGTYTVLVNDGSWVSTATKSITASTSSTASAALTVYQAGTHNAIGGTVYMALGYIDSNGYAPATLDSVLIDYNVSAAGNTVSGVLKNASGDAVTGTIAFVGTSGTYVFSAGSDGAYAAKVPAGTYDIYATDGKELVYLEKGLAVSADATKDIQMSAGYTVSMTAVYTSLMSPSTIGVGYLPLNFNVNAGGVDYAFTVVSDSNGKATLVVPAGATVSGYIATSLFAPFTNLKVVDGTSCAAGHAYELAATTVNTTVSRTFTIPAYTGDDAVTHVVPLDMTAVTFMDNDGNLCTTGSATVLLRYSASSTTYNYRATIDSTGKITSLKAYNTTASDYTDDVTKLRTGRYTVVYEGTDDLQTIGTGYIYIYPNTTKVTVDVTYNFKVTIVTENESDVIDIIMLKDSDGKTGAVSSNKTDSSDKKIHYYFLKNGFEYNVKVTDSDNTRIYYYPNIVDADPGSNIVSALADKVSFSGYVGSKIKGTIEFASDKLNTVLDVTDGNFSVELMKDTTVSAMTIEGSYEGEEYKYSITSTVLVVPGTISADLVKNYNVKTTARDLVEEKVVITAGSMSAGVGILDVKVVNDNDFDVTYFVTGSDAFILDKTYTVTVPANGDDTISVVGYYNYLTVGAGNSNASITVADSAAEKLATVTIPASYYAADVTGVPLEIFSASSEGADIHDVVDGHAYKFVFAIKNENNNLLQAQNFVISTSMSGWIFSIVDEEGSLVDFAQYDVKGYTTTKLYLMAVNETGDASAAVPEVSFSFDVGSESASFTNLVASKVDISESGASASGDEIDNSKATVSNMFWALAVLTILVLLLLVWGGMKRGVFSRKN